MVLASLALTAHTAILFDRCSNVREAANFWYNPAEGSDTALLAFNEQQNVPMANVLVQTLNRWDDVENLTGITLENGRVDSHMLYFLKAESKERLTLVAEVEFSAPILGFVADGYLFANANPHVAPGATCQNIPDKPNVWSLEEKQSWTELDEVTMLSPTRIRIRFTNHSMIDPLRVFTLRSGSVKNVTNLTTGTAMNIKTATTNGLLALLTATTGLVLNVAAANHPPTGGGSTQAGWSGAYFANPSFSGRPAFTRRDVRINFDWKEGAAGKGLPVGGATTPGMKNFPLDEFSIRWTGALVARYNEPYTFRITGQDGVRFTVGGTVLVDSLGTGIVQEVTVPMTAGQTVTAVFEYVDRAGTGASEAKLEWSSPSTPWEVIEPLSFAQSDLHLAAPGIWLQLEMADMVRMSNREGWRGADGQALRLDQVDANGWPMVSSAVIGLSQYGTRTYEGVHQIVFTGQAEVRVEGGMTGTWSTGPGGTGETFTQTLPRGKGYSAKRNTTTAWFHATTPSHLGLRFDQAERAPGQPGIANLRVYCPVARGAAQHHQPGEIYTREARVYFSDFVVLRQHIGTSQNPGETWEQRTLPAYFHREHTHHKWGYNLEELIMAANDVGKDLHLCAGASWDEEFMRKLAQLVRYGSDGVNPYDRYVENPKYPPLNPNLRIYLEHSNELPWAVYPQRIWDDLRKKVAANHPDWQIVNYDGKCNGADGTAMFRYHALRMKQLSDAFSAVYADAPAAKGDRFRALCFGQYEQPHMNTMLQFLDSYFNKADPKSTYAGEPHPPSYYFWGGGGAIYYGCNNKFGLMEQESIPNGGLEDVAVPRGTAALRPANAGWTFTGNAGICDVRLPRLAAVTVAALLPEPAAVPQKDQWVGFKFTVGEKDLFVYQLGRWVSHAHTDSNFWASPILNVAVFEEDGSQVAGLRGAPRLSTFTPDAFAYGWCATKAWGKDKALPVYLQAGKTYYLVSREKTGDKANRFYGPVDVAATPGITIHAAVIGADAKTWTETPGSLSFGPVNMLFTTNRLTTAEGTIGVPPDSSEIAFVAPWSTQTSKPEFPYGHQCAFLQGDSAMSCIFKVNKAGAYWITFSSALDRLSNDYQKQNWGGWAVTRGAGTLRVTVNGVNVTPHLLPKSGHEGRLEPFHYMATSVVRLNPGTHTVAFERVAARGGTLFVDEVHLSNEDAFYGGPQASNFPGGGNAFGQNPASGYYKTAQAECEMARNWGLVPMTYEGGWAVQGDFDHYSMLAWNDLRYGSKATNPELTKQALRNAFDIWCRQGGYIYAYFYPVTPEVAITDAPLLQCVRELNDRLPVPPEAGTPIPGTLTPDLPHAHGGVTGNYSPTWSAKTKPAELPAHNWKSWIVTAAQSGEYGITLHTTGGDTQVIVDDRLLTSGSASSGLTGRVRLTAGVHSIKVKSLGAPLAIERLTVAP